MQAFVVKKLIWTRELNDAFGADPLFGLSASSILEDVNKTMSG